MRPVGTVHVPGRGAYAPPAIASIDFSGARIVNLLRGEPQLASKHDAFRFDGDHSTRPAQSARLLRLLNFTLSAEHSESST